MKATCSCTSMRISSATLSWTQLFESVVQHDAQERSIDFNSAVVLDETQLPEFVHEQIDACARGADHLRQRLLRNLWKHSLRLVLLAVSGQQQKRPRQPLLR